jgi:hypothetical protein
LTKGIANPAHIQMFLGNLNFAAHGMLAIIFAIRMRISGLEKDLFLLAFSR